MKQKNRLKAEEGNLLKENKRNSPAKNLILSLLQSTKMIQPREKSS